MFAAKSNISSLFRFCLTYSTKSCLSCSPSRQPSFLIRAAAILLKCWDRKLGGYSGSTDYFFAIGKHNLFSSTTTNFTILFFFFFFFSDWLKWTVVQLFATLQHKAKTTKLCWCNWWVRTCRVKDSVEKPRAGLQVFYENCGLCNVNKGK